MVGWIPGDEYPFGDPVRGVYPGGDLIIQLKHHKAKVLFTEGVNYFDEI